MRSLRSRLGTQGVVAIDPVTGTARSVQKLNGTLTGPTSGDPSAIATRWIRANATAIGLGPAAVSSLTLARTVTSHGITSLRYRQSINGIPDFDNGLRVNIDRQGRILNVTGAPLNDLSLASTTPKLSAGQAMAAFQRNVGVARPMPVKSRGTGARQQTTYANGDFARLVIFGAAGGPKLAWHLTYQATSTAYYDAVVDATTGAVLYRQNLTKFDGATTDIAPNYPGADRDPKTVGTFHKNTQNATIAPNLVTRGWLPAASNDLTGPFVHTFSDVNDDNVKNSGEAIPPSDGSHNFAYPMRDANGDPGSFPAPPDTGDGVTSDGFANACDFSGTEDPQLDDPTTAEHEWPDPLGKTVDCAWDPTDPGSWDVNRAQDGVQAFYLANVYHDHLQNSAIGFNAADGNFAVNDPVEQNTDDGADSADPGNNGGPDGDHVNNANMSTPPDGISPRMQMYLFATDPDGVFTFRDINGGDDAGTVWHEYTHGLSNRLVTNDDGSGALSSAHSGAMGEAWSDWYALDFLHRPDSNPTVSNTAGPLEADDPALPDVDIGTSSDAVYTATRFQPIDCKVGEDAIRTNGDPWCVGGIDTGIGGYTFGDFGHVAGAPEVHSDGEIWMETLWDLRRELIAAHGNPAIAANQTAGSNDAEAIVTEAMRLSPPEPSFLDMRNAILAADQGLDAGANQDLIWSVFAHRGMGFFASVNDSGDTAPFENFDTPPADNASKGTVTGTVLDDTGHAVAGVPVAFGGHNTQLKAPGVSGSNFLGGTTNAQGRYAFQAPAHTYHALILAPANGFDGATIANVTVPANGTVTRNITVRRDWAATKGGAEVLKDPTKYDNTGAGFGCGLDQLADQSLGTGNSAFNPTSADPENPHLGPPTAVIKLPKTITVASFGLDPSNTCGDDPSAATKDFTIETSADGVHWTLALQGAFTPDDLHRLNLRAPTGGTTNVRYVRLRSLSPQSAQPGESGVDFIDFSEIEVYGGSALTGSLTATPPASTVGDAVSFTAAFTDPDGDTINKYAWDFDGNGTVDQTTAGPSTTFAYPAAGTFHPTVTASDTRGVTGAAATTETVTAKAAKKHRPKIGKLPRTGKKGKVHFRVTCQSRCKLVATETMSRALKRKLHVSSRRAAKLSRTLKARQSGRRITLTVSKKVRRAARRQHVKTLKLTLSVSAKTTGFKAAKKHRTVRVRL